MFAANAQAQDWGFRRGIDGINEAGGLLGRKIELIARDSAADPAKAVSFAKELIFNENVDVLCGPLTTGEAMPTLAIVSGAKKLQIVTGAVDELINPEKYPLAFRNLNTNSQWLKVSVKLMVEEMKRTKVAIINDNTGYGLLTRDGMIKFLADRGLKPVYVATVEPNKPDVTSELLKARAAGADVITEWSVATGFIARLLNARGEQNWDVPIVGHPGVLQKQVADLLTKPAYWDKVYAPYFYNSILDSGGNFSPAVQAFIAKHKDGIGPYVGAGIAYILQGNASISIYAAGVRKAGDTDSLKVAAALESIPVIDTAYGRFSYSRTDHNGFLDEGIILVEANALQPNGGYPRPKFRQ
jgi:branched-chain amino acid transport system substrate-binding protein